MPGSTACVGLSPLGAPFLIQGLVQAAQFSIGDYGTDVQVAKALALSPP